jgi:hypothetical protein
MVDRRATATDRMQARLEIQADDIDGVTWLDAGSDHAPGTIVEVRPYAVADDFDFLARAERVLAAAAPVAVTARRSLPLVATTIGSFGRGA